MTMSSVNDFAFKIATVNGTGSASANSLIMQAIFRMGIPVSGKNVFPSNIQGLPTWYEIRVNKDGYTARSSRFDLVVALNPATYQRDVAEVRPGGFLLYDSSWRMDATDDYIIIDGNTAAALGCLYAGATVGAWYPITPATSLMEAFKGLCERYRVDKETGRKRFCILQAEDELAAAGIVIGAGWTGARAFTPTAGPGISLMQEFIGLAYYTEIPAVFFDVQRVGPSTGMPTRTQQADLLSLAYASHGDTKHIVLFPSSPEECFAFAARAFDLAERFQTPVFVASDLDIGMNDWMCKRLTWDDSYRPDRGKVLGAEQLERLGRFSRYLSENGDAIAARTLPGIDPRGA